MGAVYRATDTKLGHDVAIKLLPASFSNDPERLVRFVREAQVLASLNHEFVTGNYFSVLGVKAYGRRLFTPEDDRPSAVPVAVLSHHALAVDLRRRSRVVCTACPTRCKSQAQCGVRDKFGRALGGF
jgi:hypothetical protein